MSDKISIEDLNQPDVFHTLSDQALQLVETHARKIVLGIGLVLLAIAIYLSLNYFRDRREAAAAEAIFPAVESFAKSPDKTELPIKIIEAHANTRAAVVGAMELSSVLSEKNRVTDAEAVLDAVHFGAPKHDIVGALFALRRGLVKLEVKKTADAIPLFRSIAEDSSLKELQPEAYLKWGLCLAESQDAPGAERIWSKLIAEFPESEAASEAEILRRHAQMKIPGQ